MWCFFGGVLSGVATVNSEICSTSKKGGNKLTAKKNCSPNDDVDDLKKTKFCANAKHVCLKHFFGFGGGERVVGDKKIPYLGTSSGIRLRGAAWVCDREFGKNWLRTFILHSLAAGTWLICIVLWCGSVVVDQGG